MPTGTADPNTVPVVSGNEVLAETEERGLPCRVAMVTAVDPDFDIIDMGCDDYLVKPIARADLLDVVDRLKEEIAALEDEVEGLAGELGTGDAPRDLSG